MNELTLREAMDEYAKIMLKATGIEKPTRFCDLVDAYWNAPIEIIQRNLGIVEENCTDEKMELIDKQVERRDQ